ncbi:unnamed protein product, partial [marine sediment metagenome]
SPGEIEEVLDRKLSKKEEGRQIAEAIKNLPKKEKVEWVSNTYTDICNILERKPLRELYLKKEPLAFLLILCDNLQDCERPCEEKEKKAMMEALDVRLGRIIPDIECKKVTIRLYFNDVTEGSDWRSEKTKLLKKIEKLLRSPDIKFIVEYWDRETNSQRMNFTIH